MQSLLALMARWNSFGVRARPKLQETHADFVVQHGGVTF
jgi:hypothetical protein